MGGGGGGGMPYWSRPDRGWGTLERSRFGGVPLGPIGMWRGSGISKPESSDLKLELLEEKE